jgi:hypothetical protein
MNCESRISSSIAFGNGTGDPGVCSPFGSARASFEHASPRGYSGVRGFAPPHQAN